MSARLSCPDRSQLLSLLRGEATAEQASALRTHLERCLACRQAVQGLPGSDSSQLPTALPETGVFNANSRLVAFSLPAADGKGERIGPYQIQQVVGTGTIGRVLKAFDPVLQRVVALKVLAEPLAAVPAARRRFFQEAQAAAAISHANVITIHAVKEIDGQAVLVMEYIPGQSLQQRLQRSDPFETVEMVRLGMQIAAGLAAAHALKLVHRDLKPSNILLEGDTGNLKLTDFGLAQVAAEVGLHQNAFTVGEPGYCSPEQARGEVVDARSDLFGLGSLLYHLCAGHPPFHAPDGPAVIQRILTDTPRPLRAINPGTPRWLAAIVSKLMEKDPAERYPSANKVVQELGQQLLRLEQTLPVPLPGVRIHRPTRKRQRLLGWSLALAGILLVAGLGLTGWLSGWLSPGKPADPATPGPAPVKDEWTSLFNGIDLTGWNRHSEQSGSWTVEGGYLTGRGARRRSHLFGDRGDYENFHLRIQARIHEKGDSGLYFRCDRELADGSSLPAGYEAQLVGDKSTATMKTGSLCHLVDRQSCPLATTSKWFVYEVIAQGNHLQTRLDGQLVADFIDVGCQYANGHLAWQLFGPDTIVQFRKIEIKELPPTPVRREPILVRRFRPSDASLRVCARINWSIGCRTDCQSVRPAWTDWQSVLQPIDQLILARRLSSKDVIGDGDGWRLDYQGPQRVYPLFQIANPKLGPGVLRFSGQMQVQTLAEATLVMVCQFKDGRTTTFNDLSPNRAAAGWHELSNRLYQMHRSEGPNTISVELRVSGEGEVRFKDLEIWHFPAVPTAALWPALVARVISACGPLEIDSPGLGFDVPCDE